jgi:hypothetical protein
MSMTARLAGTVDAAGGLTLTLRVVGGRPWSVSQVSVEMANAGGSATGVLRFNGFLVAPFVPQADAVGGDPPITMQPTSDELTVVWANAVAGVSGQALFIYDFAG